MEVRDKAHEMALALCAELGIAAADAGKLAEVPVDRLIAAQVAVEQRQDSRSRDKGVYSQRGFGPTVGAEGLPDWSFDPVATEVSAGVPILIGTNTHELSLFFYGDPKIGKGTLTDDELRQRVTTMAGDAAGHVLDVYGKEYPNASAGGAVDPRGHRPHLSVRLDHAGAAQGGAGKGRRLHVPVRLADAGARRPTVRAARDRDPVRVRQRGGVPERGAWPAGGGGSSPPP